MLLSMKSTPSLHIMIFSINPQLYHSWRGVAFENFFKTQDSGVLNGCKIVGGIFNPSIGSVMEKEEGGGANTTLGLFFFGETYIHGIKLKLYGEILSHSVRLEYTP